MRLARTSGASVERRAARSSTALFGIRMKYSLLSLLSLGVMGVAAAASTPVPGNWIHVDAKFFEFFIPPDMKKVEIQGIDSHVGQFGSEKIKLIFDYGMYSDPLDDEKGMPNLTVRKERIDGRRTKIVSFRKSESDFVLAVHFPKAGPGYKGGRKLTLYTDCVSESEYDTVMKIFRSIKFR